MIPQHTLDYTDNLNSIKPDVVVHGDDWKAGVQASVRQKVLDTLSQWGGDWSTVIYGRYFFYDDQRIIKRYRNYS